MATREQIRDLASTLAHHWTGSDPAKDREGVRRMIVAVPEAWRVPLCAHVLRYLELRGWYVPAERFESMLFDLAGIEDDGTASDLQGLPDMPAEVAS